MKTIYVMHHNNFGHQSSSLIIEKHNIFMHITIKFRIILSTNPHDNLKSKRTNILK